MITYEHASPDNPQDDAMIRELLREQNMSGWVSLTLEREPAFFAKKWPGHDEYAVIARDGNTVVGMYTYEIQHIYLEGNSVPIGYLGGLRVSSTYRNQWQVIKQGFASIKQLMPQTPLNFSYSSIASDNIVARRLLEAQLSGKPKYHSLGEMVTLALPVAKKKSMKNGWRRLQEKDIPVLLAFHQATAKQFQFAPVLTEAMVHYIGITNFYGYWQEKMEACVAIWNQSEYKQVVARGYQKQLTKLRLMYNLYAHFTKQIKLPSVGQALSQSYLAFLAFSPLALPKFSALIQDILTYCHSETAILGLYAEHPKLNSIAFLKPLEYRTKIYAVSHSNAYDLNGGIIQPEVAIL